MKAIFLVVFTISLIWAPKLVTPQIKYSLFCETCDCLKTNKDQYAIIQGVLQHSDWGWVLHLSDNKMVLISDILDIKGPANFSYSEWEKLRRASALFDTLQEKKVLVKGYIFYGVVFEGGGVDKQGNAIFQRTGLKIYPVEVKIFNEKTKKEWINK